MPHHDIDAETVQALTQLSTGKYGPLYIVSANNGQRRIAQIFQLDHGQILERERSTMGPCVPHSDLREDQEVFGLQETGPHWSSLYGWHNHLPNVQNGHIQELLQQLLEANQLAMGLGIMEYWERQLWLQRWSHDNLGRETMALPLPNLEDSVHPVVK